MGQVCRKHEEFYEDICRWCEPVSVCLGTMTGVAEAVGAEAPNCLYCSSLATWVWTGIETGARTEMCQMHHDMQSHWQKHRLADWTTARLP